MVSTQNTKKKKHSLYTHIQKSLFESQINPNKIMITNLTKQNKTKAKKIYQDHKPNQIMSCALIP
jgi:CRISPR/Cas system-associated endoribonuclease Cas2